MANSVINSTETWNLYAHFNGFTYLVERGIGEETVKHVETGQDAGNYSCVLNPAKRRGVIPLGAISKHGESYYLDLPPETRLIDIMNAEILPYRIGRKVILKKETIEDICQTCGINFVIQYTSDGTCNIIKQCACGECEG